MAEQRKRPEPEHLQVGGDWKDAIKRALSKKRPKGGWPKAKKKRPEGE